MSDFNIPTELLEPKKDKRLENLKNSKKSEPKPEPVVESEKLPRVIDKFFVSIVKQRKF